jgi:NADPH-dependent F420 reductase
MVSAVDGHDAGAGVHRVSVALVGGTGKLGSALGLRLARAGHPVIIGSRDPARAAQAAEDLNTRLAEAGGAASSARATGADNAAAAAGAEVIVVTVPYENQRQTLLGLAASVGDRVVVSTAVPIAFVPGQGPSHVEVAEGSAAEQVAAALPRARVVSALQTVSSATLARLDRDVDADIIVTGDDAEAKARVAGLLGILPGARLVDGGPLRNSRYVEQLTVLLLTINLRVKRSTGIRVTNLPDAAAMPLKPAVEIGA